MVRYSTARFGTKQMTIYIYKLLCAARRSWHHVSSRDLRHLLLMCVVISSMDSILLSLSQVLGSGRDEIDGHLRSIAYRVSLHQKRQWVLKRSARYKRYLISIYRCYMY